MLNASIIGGRIAAARKCKNLSQAQLGALMSVSPQAIGKWERGESMPDIIAFAHLAEVTGVDLSFFMGESSVSEPKLPQACYTEEGAAAETSFAPAPEAERAPGWNMSGYNWIDADFSGLKGLHEKFNGANIKGCKFVGAELSGIRFNGNNTINNDFSESNLSKSTFNGSNIKGNSFVRCAFESSIFNGSNIIQCDFSEANFKNASFKGSKLKDLIISNAVFEQTSFRSSQFIKLVFEGDITGCSFENCNYSKVEFRNVTFSNTFFKGQSMRRVSFVNCRADNISYSFLKNIKADMSGIELV
ncbi:MAG: pentapeptide repeat-containing protein [Oscillospiraceae bacterium]|jgi:uncharacterized protein YjbI with pentapeptide repeats/DNA-binding XRE family transcriptional regulator|nr:pentapeptide repeat-containing protein [Oscillospiraceae bacterium]